MSPCRLERSEIRSVRGLDDEDGVETVVVVVVMAVVREEEEARDKWVCEEEEVASVGNSNVVGM